MTTKEYILISKTGVIPLSSLLSIFNLKGQAQVSTTYFGIHAGTVRCVVEAARKLTRQGDLSHWRKFCERLDGVSMLPTLSLTPKILNIPGPSLLQVDAHWGVAALDPEVVPDIDHPGFGRAIRTLLEQTAILRAQGRFDGLRGSLLDGLDRSKYLQSQAETEVFDRFVETLFDTAADLTEEQRFLAIEDGFWSSTTPAVLAGLLSTQNVAVLQTVTNRLLDSTVDSTTAMGRELQRIIRIGQLALIDDLCLWVIE